MLTIWIVKIEGNTDKKICEIPIYLMHAAVYS